MKTLEQIFGIIVSTFFTTTGGVSLSEVSRIQAENKQQNDKFWSAVSDAVSGVFREVIAFLGAEDSTPRTFPGATISPEAIRQYSGVAERNAQTAGLMHALKLHKRLQDELKGMDLRLHVVETLPEAPMHPSLAKRGSTCDTDKFMELSNVDEMIAALNPEVLAEFDFAFWKEANELNSRAAALGKLLSENGSFFRELVKALPKGDKKLTQTGCLVTTWERSYSDENIGEFSRLREELQSEYNGLQQQLNGCRKQIKDAVRAYNLDAERQYQTAYGLYQVEERKHSLEMERIRSAAETLRQQALQEIASLRVRVE